MIYMNLFIQIFMKAQEKLMKAVIVFNRMWAPAKRQIICIVVIVFVWVICL